MTKENPVFKFRANDKVKLKETFGTSGDTGTVVLATSLLYLWTDNNYCVSFPDSEKTYWFCEDDLELV
jgi:hypothetical protein